MGNCCCCSFPRVHPIPSRHRARLAAMVAVPCNDDTAEGQRFLTRLLQKHYPRWNIKVVPRLEEVVRQCENRRVDVVFISSAFDGLAGMTGVEAARAIRQAEPSCIAPKPHDWLPVTIVMTDGLELSFMGARRETLMLNHPRFREDISHDIYLDLWMLWLYEKEEGAELRANLRGCLGCSQCFGSSLPAHLCGCQRRNVALHRRAKLALASYQVFRNNDLLATIMLHLQPRDYPHVCAVSHFWEGVFRSVSQFAEPPPTPKLPRRQQGPALVQVRPTCFSSRPSRPASTLPHPQAAIVIT